MVGMIQKCWRWLRPSGYRRLAPLVLINGLAEQAESWFCNRLYWERYFDVKVPEFLVYDGPRLQERIERGEPIDVAYLTRQLEIYLEEFVQIGPFNLVASSLGGQIACEYAARHPNKIGRLVLLCPSGFGGEERLPIVDGVRHNDFYNLIGSVFYSRKYILPELVEHYEQKAASRTWKRGLLRTVRGTSEHCVRDRLVHVRAPTLIICGQHDRIVSSDEVRDAVRHLPNFRYVSLARCGHAPQIERCKVVNRMVRYFLTTTPQPIPSRAMPEPVLAAKPSLA
jgi:pimeloyl-ACP methyl ester carboxylesterase